MVDIPEELIARVTIAEGLMRLPYKDSRGIETIGIGHNLSKPLSVAACDFILMEDLRDAQRDLDAALDWAASLGLVRYWSLVELAFNMGLGVPGGPHGLLSFGHTLLSLRQGQYVNAAKSLLQSRWAEEVGEQRSQRIARQLETGLWA